MEKQINLFVLKERIGDTRDFYAPSYFRTMEAALESLKKRFKVEHFDDINFYGFGSTSASIKHEGKEIWIDEKYFSESL